MTGRYGPDARPESPTAGDAQAASSRQPVLSFAARWKLTTTLTAASGGTELLVVHEGIPDNGPVADNGTGTRMALANLARLVEAG